MPRHVKYIAAAFAILIALGAWKGLNALLHSAPALEVQLAEGGKSMAQKIQKTDEDWKKTLTPEQYRVMRQCGTEAPFSGKFNDHYEKGIYVCTACRTPLFLWDTKYDHKTGWPSFTAPADEKALEYREDNSLLMKRTEVRCASCGAHLGHVFNDGPAPSFSHYCINSAALDFIPAEEMRTGANAADGLEKAAAVSEPAAAPKAETAVFAAGCFWGVEHKFRQVRGVTDTMVGYTGGSTSNPDYAQVCTDKTGHAEAVRITFDPSIVSYENLVRLFFTIHDPTQIDRQGPDVGTQYRSVIFYENDNQREAARKVMDELQSSGRFKNAMATSLVPASEFFKAEDYHQRYYEKVKKTSCSF